MLYLGEEIICYNVSEKLTRITNTRALLFISKVLFLS